MREVLDAWFEPRWRAAAVAAAVLLSLAVTDAAPATATPTRVGFNVYSLRDQETHRCLDSNAAGRVYTNPCQAPGNPYQDWIKYTYYSGYAFQDLATGRCLDGNAAGSVYTNPCQAPGNPYQVWVVGNGGPGYFNLGVYIQTLKARDLDSNSAGNAYTTPDMGDPFQYWVTTTYTLF
jgi:hypothetical protein